MRGCVAVGNMANRDAIIHFDIRRMAVDFQDYFEWKARNDISGCHSTLVRSWIIIQAWIITAGNMIFIQRKQHHVVVIIILVTRHRHFPHPQANLQFIFAAQETCECEVSLDMLSNGHWLCVFVCACLCVCVCMYVCVSACKMRFIEHLTWLWF